MFSDSGLVGSSYYMTLQLLQYSHTFANEVTIDNAYISHAASTHENQLNGRHVYTIEIKKKLSKKCLR